MKDICGKHYPNKAIDCFACGLVNTKVKESVHLKDLLSYGGDIPSLTKEVLSLRLENERLKAALEFYAMPEATWVRSAALAADKGFTARNALGLGK